MQLIRLTVFLLFFSVSVYGQSTGSCRKSTEGTDFWFGFMESRNYNNGHYTEITVTSGNTCNYKIFIGKSTLPFTTGTVTPNLPVKVTIDWKLVEAIGSENIQAKAIHLVSDNPLNVYALNWCPSSADVALIFPKESLGNEYYAMCYTPHVHMNGANPGNGRNSEFLIVASEDSTVVWITPTKITDKLQPANIPFKILLSRGELYQVQSANLVNLPGQGDLTGSYIKSDKPVAFYSGSLSTTVPGDATVSAWDHLYEQIPPLQTWGRKFIAVPLRSREKDTYRVLAAEDSTEVRVGTTTLVPRLKKGEYREFMLMYTNPSLIESDKPILLAQYSNSNNVDRTFNGGDGDPFMVIVSPVNQTREKVAFVAYDSQNITNKYFINVVVKDDAVGKIKLDNNTIIFTPLSGTGYSYAQVNLVTKGNHLIETTEEGKGFIAYVYGFGGVESYGYGVGFNLDIVLDLGSNINAIGKLLVRCDGADPLTLNAGNAFDNYLWSTGDTISSIKVNEAGWYSVTASLDGGCELKDSVELQISKPIVDLGRDTTLCNPGSILLDAGNQINTFTWSVAGNAQTVSIHESGTYSVTGANLYGCKASDSIKVTFVDKPRINLSKLDTLMCGKYSEVMDIAADKAVSWLLESTNPKMKIEGFTASVLPADIGTYGLEITATDEFSCVSDATVNLGFYDSPIVDLGNDTTICNPATLELNAGGLFADYLWSTSATTPGIVVKSDGTYAVNITDKNGCKTSDQVKVSFTNKPKIDFTGLDTLICGKKSALLDVTSDKGSITVQRLSDRFVFNTLNVAVPDFGSYDFNIKATDQFSCYSDSVVRFGFHKTPIVNFSVDSTKCYGYNLDVKYSGDATVATSEFIWVFGGDTIKQGIGIDAYLVPLGVNRATRDLTLTVTDQGCANRQTLHDIKVIPNLRISVSDTLGCEPFTTRFRAENTETVTYAWDFGDGNVLNGLTADPSHTYLNDGYYPVKLVVTTDKGCSNEIVTDSMVYVAPIPTIGFTTFPRECLGSGEHSISYAGTADNKDTYNWNLSAFDPGEIIQNPADSQGPFIFNLKNKPQATLGLKVISKYGCRSDSATVLVKRKPVFSVIPSHAEGCVPFEPVLTGIINDPADKVDFSWDFGDGSSDSGPQVTHTYEQPDQKYTITLSGRSSVTGCSDTLVSADLLRSYPKPEAAFTMDNTTVYNDEPTVNFVNLSTGAVSWLWDFGDESTSDSKDPSHYYIKTGYRNVLLTSMNEFQCSDTVSHKVLVAFDRIFPPTGFSPNAPDMVDREFKLGSDGVAAAGYHLTILSRWNDIVFEARDEIKGWNGQMPNGSYAPAGTYVWILNFNDFLGRRHRQTGTVTVVY